MYKNQRENIEEIKGAIREEINRLNANGNIISASLDRLRRGYRACFENNGGYIEHLDY